MEQPGQVVDERRAGRWMSALIMFILVAGVLSFVWSSKDYWLLPLASTQGAHAGQPVLRDPSVDRDPVRARPPVYRALPVAVPGARHGARRALARAPRRGADLDDRPDHRVHHPRHLRRGRLGADLQRAAGERQQVQVVGRQFEWEFRYPGPDGKFGRTAPKFVTSGDPFGMDPSDPENQQNVVTINDLHVVLNRPVSVRITAIDVIHSFSLPNFRMKQDAVPGRDVEHLVYAEQSRHLPDRLRAAVRRRALHDAGQYHGRVAERVRPVARSRKDIERRSTLGSLRQRRRHGRRRRTRSRGRPRGPSQGNVLPPLHLQHRSQDDRQAVLPDDDVHGARGRRRWRC